jgi:hypothetical protein
MFVEGTYVSRGYFACTFSKPPTLIRVAPRSTGFENDIHACKDGQKTCRFLAGTIHALSGVRTNLNYTREHRARCLQLCHLNEEVQGIMAPNFCKEVAESAFTHCVVDFTRRAVQANLRLSSISFTTAVFFLHWHVICFYFHELNQEIS